MNQLNKWEKELQQLSEKQHKATDSELFNLYREVLINIKKQLLNYTQAYPTLTFSSRLEVERLFNVAVEIDDILSNSLGSIESAIKDYSYRQAEQGYYGVWYTLEQSENIQLAMPTINHNYVMNLVNAPVAGKRLSKRLYAHRDELANNVSNHIINGLFGGESYAKIAKRISDETEANYKQALRIAITEGGRTSSITQQQSSENAKALGVGLKKKWLATLDGKTRYSHRELDGQTVDIDEEFTIRGYHAKQPRLFGVAKEDIRCRCTTINIVDGISPELRRDNETKALVKYKNYNEWLQGKENQAKDAIIGLKTPDGVTINNLSAHFYDRRDGRNVDIKAVAQTIKSPIWTEPATRDRYGRLGQRLVGHKTTVVLNPETGNIATIYKTQKRYLNKARKERGY